MESNWHLKLIVEFSLIVNWAAYLIASFTPVKIVNCLAIISNKYYSSRKFENKQYFFKTKRERGVHLFPFYYK